MEFLLSHWHCILPAAAIPIGLILMNRSKSKREGNPANRAGAHNTAHHKEGQNHA